MILERQLQEARGKIQGTPVPLESGFVRPAAIFLLVVLGGLAAWLMQLTTVTLAQEALELVGARAYQAAQAGLEAGIYAASQAAPSCTSKTISGFTGQLASFTASVTCTAYTADEGGVTINLYRITSVACNQPALGACPNPAPALGEYAERQLTATVQP